MLIDVRLQNFRSYQEAAYEFNDGVNIVVGPNASGKTNLLESILVLLTGNSYRVQTDSELVQFGADWARIDGTTIIGDRTVKIERLDEARTAKTYVVGEKPFKRLTANHTEPVVVFEPEHMLLLTSRPQLRRSYMDTLLSRTVPGYDRFLAHYKRALTQRNTLLKQGHKAVAGQGFIWSVRLSELGGYVATERFKLIDDMVALASDTYSRLAGKTSEVSFIYKTPFAADVYGSQLMKALEQNIDKDIMRGFTSYGPHREDLTVLLNGKLASETASRGETRTLLLTLKILELQLLEKAAGTKPLLLLDDVFSELDGARRRALATSLQGYQTFITTTDADVVVHHFMNDCTIIPTGDAGLVPVEKTESA